MIGTPACILFDFDGVVLASSRLKIDAFAQVYEGEPTDLVAEVIAYQEAHGGIGRREKFIYFESDVFGRAADQNRIDELCTHFAEIVDRAMLAVDFVPGALDALMACHRRIELHVVSGMPDAELNAVVDARGLRQFFSSVTGSPTSKEEAFADILHRRRLIAADCLAVGDSTTEFHAARALGIPFLAVVAPGESNRFPQDVPVVPDMRTLPSLVGLSG